MKVQRIGPYELVQRLGRGSEGQVWRATAPDGSEVAIKLGPYGASASSFHAEALAMSRLDHPAIVDVWDLGHDEGRPWLVMELAEGPLRLDDIHSWSELRALLLRLLDGLACAHARDLIHRDVKPQNLLRYGDGVRIADFGLSATATTDLITPAAAGTPRYMAPEQVRGHIHAFGPWTDLYALGSTAWELASGAPVFPGGDPGQVLQAHLNRRAPTLHPRFDVPLGLADWLGGLLAKRPQDRFPSAAVARLALAALGDPVPSTARIVALASYDDAAATTLYLEPFADRPTPVQAEATPPRARVEAPESLPPDLPTVRPRRPSTALRFREIPLAGRETDQALLWAHARAEAFRVVAITGEPGVGTSSLGRWVAGQLHRFAGRRLLLGRAGTGPDDGLRGVLRQILGCHGLDDRAIATRTEERLEQDGVCDPWVVRTLVACQQHQAAPMPTAQRAVAFADGLARREGTVVFLDDASGDGATWRDIVAMHRVAPERTLTLVLTGHTLHPRAADLGDAVLHHALAPVGRAASTSIVRTMGVLHPGASAALADRFDGAAGAMVRWIREHHGDTATTADLDKVRAAWLWRGWVDAATLPATWRQHAMALGLDPAQALSWAQRTERLAVTRGAAHLLPRALDEARALLPPAAQRRALPERAPEPLTPRWALALHDDDALRDQLARLVHDGRHDEVLGLLALRGADRLPPPLRAIQGRALHLVGRVEEAFAALSSVVNEIPTDRPLWAEAFEALASSAFNLGRTDAYLERGLATLPDVPPPGRALVQARLASLCASSGRGDQAATLLASYRFGGDDQADLVAHRLVAIQAQRRGDVQQAATSFRDALACAERIGATNHRTLLLGLLAYAEDHLGRPKVADARYAEAWAAVATEVDLCSAGNLAIVQGANLLSRGRREEARGLLTLAARRFRQLDNSEEGIALLNLAMLELADGQDAEARRVARAAAEVFDRAGRGAFAQTARTLWLAAADDLHVTDIVHALESGPTPVWDTSIADALREAVEGAARAGHRARREALEALLASTSVGNG